MKLTRPVSSGGSRAVSACITNRFKDSFPAPSGIAPVLWLQDESSLRAIGNHEAVDDVMQLATITTALIDVAHQLSCLSTVWWVLDKVTHIHTLVNAHSQNRSTLLVAAWRIPFRLQYSFKGKCLIPDLEYLILFILKSVNLKCIIFIIYW